MSGKPFKILGMRFAALVGLALLAGPVQGQTILERLEGKLARGSTSCGRKTCTCGR